VAIARALAFDPPLLLADEPTAHLDYAQVEIVLRTLRALAAPGRLVLVSTHDDRITPLADRVIDLTPGLTGPNRTQKIRLDPGEVIFEAGTRGGLIYVVERGEVEVIRVRVDGSEEVLARYGPKEYFGELAPLLGFPRAGTARARTASVLTGYTVTEFRERLGADKLSKLLGKAATGSKRKPSRRQAPKKRKPKPKSGARRR
jgi:putative ABC transport system ATP-binding protein